MADSVVVVGGGVIGLACAFALQRSGMDVTVIDAGPRELAASHVNAGWVCPTLCEPVPSPGLVTTSARWMLKSDSPLYIKPRFDRSFSRWLMEFWKHCNARDYHAGTAATAALSARTLELYDDLREHGVQFEEHEDGLLFAYVGEEAMHHDYDEIRWVTEYGFEMPDLLDGDAARALEPGLSDEVVGGYWMRHERSVRPDTLVTGFRDRLREGGAVIRDGERVVGFGARDGRVTSVVTDAATYAASTVVVAAGAWTPQILEPLGVRVPIEAGKGYRIDFAPPPVTLTKPLYLHESRVAITPMNGSLRLAGTMELSGLNHVVRPERVQALLRRTGEAIRDWPAEVRTDAPGVKVWHGPRPLTPDGLPVIGWMPGWRNLAVASGHSMLGVTLAPATGEAVAEMIVSGRTPEVLRPFDPARFNNRSELSARVLRGS